MASISKRPSATTKRVLILDSSARGHHPFYARSLLESGLADCADIIFAAPKEMFLHPAIVACAATFRPHPVELGLESSAGRNVILRSWAVGKTYRKAFFAVSQSAPIDFVIVPYLDDCLLGLAAPRGAFGATPWLAITMRTMFHYRRMGVTAPRQSFAAIRRWLAYRILRQKSTAALLTIDPTLAQFAAGQSNPIFRKIQYVPDPATRHSALPSKMEARRRLDIPADARVVLLYGAITERKGTSLLVKAAAAPECSNRIHLLIAGRYWNLEQLQQSDAWRLLAAERRIHAFNGFVDDEQEQLILASADCMWVGYIDFYGVSSVMALAGRHAMPVMASDYGLVGYLAKKHDLGALIQPGNKLSIVSALNQLVNQPELFVRTGRNGVAVYQDHDPIELQRLVIDTITQSWAR